jgi:hypothetical protein
MSARTPAPPAKLIPWVRIVAEATAIVLSILLAFAIDAWWDRLGHRREEAAALAALHAEFLGAEQEITRAREVHLERLAATTALLRFTNPIPTAASIDSAATLLWSLLRMTTLDPPQAALAGLVGGGRIALLKDRALAGRLLAWPGLLEDHAKTEDNVRSNIREHLFLWLAAHTPLPTHSEPTRFETDLRPVLQNFTFETHVRWIKVRTDIVLEENAGLAAEARAILDLIEANLGR